MSFMKAKRNFLSLCGAIGGGLLGHFGFRYLLRSGLYAMVLPGGLTGLGAGIPRGQSKWVAAVSALLALGVSLFTEWRSAPFEADGSFSYFLAHLANLRPVTLLMMAVGAGIGFWVPFRRSSD